MAPHRRHRADAGQWGLGECGRVAPLGARFHAGLDRTAEQAVLSTVVTHAHPEGIAGTVAVAVLSARGEFTLEAVAARTPEGPVHDGVLRAGEVSFTTEAWRAAGIPGNGQRAAHQGRRHRPVRAVDRRPASR